MSTISLVILVSGLAATLLFLAGFSRGVNRAIAARNDPSSTEAPDEAGHLGTAIFAVIASAVVIALVGVVPSAIYIGPFLAIFTAAAVGVAFFVER
ncbi:hypothetical protein [Dongia rigui]|uniref:Uncharacterized protein n=1 Tax=Dongia rigui TaxID=940149 RepID=A0ABU5E0A1_9PROT|nr:hypothetical protein [Dongia rigui]MDY0873014.1 hypothetical protein [Dongia rigui]